MKKSFRVIVVLLFFTTITSCNKDNPQEKKPDHNPTPYEITIPFGFPTMLNIPADNPMTVEGVELGRILFYDGRITGSNHPDSMMSCATCHLQEKSFECGVDHPKYTGGFTFGLSGEPTPHVMLPLINLVFNNTGYLWNGFVEESNENEKYRNIEALTIMSIIAPHEMNSDTNRSKAMIASIPGYDTLFEAAFGTPEVTVDRMSKAISQFIRTIISANSRFDKYMRGQVQLTPSELNGYVLFTTEEGADCFHCHGGGGNPLFTTNLYYNNGKDTLFTDDRDRFAITGIPSHHGAYKAPTLRNIIFTAPYMHDGRFSTLDEVIDFYSSAVYNSPYIDPLMHHVGTNGAQLTPLEKADLKAFLLTLTDEEILTDPAFSRPEKLPGE